MSRHADPDPRHFWRSLLAAAVRATLALGVVAGLFAALSTIGRTIPEDGPVILGGPDLSDLPDPPDDRGTLPPTAGPQRPPPAVPPPDPPPDRDEPPVEEEPADASLAAAPAPEETRVQVLDGVNDPARLAALTAALEALGYRVVASNPASTDYAVTTVLYGEDHEAAATAMRVRDPRIVEQRPSPGLSDQVDLHVVLGADWQP